LRAVGRGVRALACGARARIPAARAEARSARDCDRRSRNARREAASVSRARAVERVVRHGAPCRPLDVPGAVIVDALFSQLVVLGSSGMLLTALIVLWRRGVPAYIAAYRSQSWLLGAVTACVGYFGDAAELYAVALILILLKA